MSAGKKLHTGNFVFTQTLKTRRNIGLKRSHTTGSRRFGPELNIHLHMHHVYMSKYAITFRFFTLSFQSYCTTAQQNKFNNHYYY